MSAGVRGCINCNNFKRCFNHWESIREVTNYRTQMIYYKGEDCFNTNIAAVIDGQMTMGEEFDE